MAWDWRFEKQDGTAVEPGDPPGEFSTQGDAETWIGEVWQDLRGEGVDQVLLREDGNTVYGPMSLHEAG
ncbi:MULTISPECIES: hypothetical protein [Streptomyces]|uniref:hypothetical protein n=1 Tax=Streptomyces TaxID=1883 RepID=UPI000CD4B5E1|nr:MULTISPECIES: hypothetical protein [Streptomyces]